MANDMPPMFCRIPEDNKASNPPQHNKPPYMLTTHQRPPTTHHHKGRWPGGIGFSGSIAILACTAGPRPFDLPLAVQRYMRRWCTKASP